MQIQSNPVWQSKTAQQLAEALVVIDDQQAMQNFNPNKHTAEISWKVLQAVIADLTKS